MYVTLKHHVKLTVCLLLTMLIILSSSVLSACKKPDPTPDANNPFSEFINSTQKRKIEELAEAFAESGYSFDTSNPITFRNVESFICYYYDDKVLAGDNGYGKVPAADADAFCEEVFGVKPTLRYNHTFVDEVLFYFDDDSQSYFVKYKENFASEVEIDSIELLKEGGLMATVNVTGAEGSKCMLKLTFNLNKDAVRISSCKRYDFN